MIRDVYLHGRLGTKFGKVHALDVESPAEAFQALSHLIPGFRDYVCHRKYCVSVGKGSVLDAEQLDLRLGQGRDIHLTPAGLLSGIETIILGGILLFTAVTAVAVLSMPQVPPPGSREEATKTNSFIFDGPTQSTEQGHPPALIYGRVRVGSVVGSSGIATTDVNEAGVSANPSNPGSGGGGGGYSGFVGSTPGIRDSPYGNEWQYQLAKGGKGGGGGSTRSAQEDPNSLQSQATAKILDIIGEGEIVGLVDGLKSVYFDNTPLQNADGTFNFAGVAVEQRTGLPDQDFIPGFSQTENTNLVDQRVSIAAGPVTKTIADSSVTVARVTIRLPQLYRQDVTNGDLKFASVSVKISVQADGGGFTDVTTMDFNGKTTSGYQRSVDVRLPNGNQREVRVTRITADSELSSLVNETRWDLLTEVVEAKLSYPDTALIGLTVDARQFGSNIPSRGFEVKGLIIDVPSNYNPETRVYTGVWDGTFKRAWTDNPAWVFRDLIVNRRYGLGTRIDPSQVNKWSLYSIAQYNDELIPDGMGGTQPRYTINCCINTRADAREVLASIASNFRGWAYLTSGSIMAAQDRPEDPSILVTPSNTADGKITYGRITSAERRRSVAIVYWNDPDDNYKLTPEVYEVPDLVRRFGRRTGDEVTAFGVTNRGQAHRMARWIMEDEAAGSNSIATYDVGDDHSFVEPGRIAALADPMFTASRRGGRVVSASANQVVLDAPVNLVGGQAYTLRVTLPDGSVRVRSILNGAGPADTLDLGGNAYALVPRPGAVWTVESTTVANRQFRVRSIQQDEPPYRVRAVLHDPTKYERVELDRDISSPNFMELPSGPLERPSGLDIAEFLLPDGTASVPAVQFSWNSPVDPRISFFQVQFQRPGGSNWEPLDDGISVSRSIRGATPGDWSFRVRGLDALGNKTAWIVYTETLGAQQSGIPNVSQLALAISNEALAAALVWATPVDPRPLRAEVLFSLSNFAQAQSLGVIDGQEFPVSQPGRYWVRSAFMDARSANPPSVLIEPADLPQVEVEWDNVQNRPNSLGELDPAFALALNNTLDDLQQANVLINQAVQNLDGALDDLDQSTSQALGALDGAIQNLNQSVDQLFPAVFDPTTGLTYRMGQAETKVNNGLERVSTLETQVQTPGSGALAKIGSLETATANLQTGKADASRVTTLESQVQTPGSGALAKIGSLETATANLQTGKAEASRVTALEARANGSANIIPNSTGAARLRGWTENTPGSFNTIVPGDGPRFYTEPSAGGPKTEYIYQGFIPVIAGNPYSFQAEIAAIGRTAGWISAYVSWRNDQNQTLDTTVLYLPVNATGFWNKLVAENYIAPLGAVTATIVIAYENAVFNSGAYVAWRRLKLEFGSVATAWTDEATDVQMAARVTSSETATADLQSGKADASRVNTLETQIQTPVTGALAKIGSLETATSDLQSGKADASRVTTLEGQVQTPGTGLLARAASLETATANLQTGKADASRVTTLEVRAVALPNLIQDGSFNAPLGVNWYLEGGAGPTINYDPQVGSFLRTPGQYLVSRAYVAVPGNSFSVSWSGVANDPDAHVYIQALPSYALLARAFRNSANNWGQRYVSDGTSVLAPAGTTGFRVVIDTKGSPADLSRIKVNYGSTATQWTDELTNRESSASIRTLETVTANLQTGKADASRVTQLESRVQNVPNLLLNSDFSQNLKYWTATGGGALWTTYKDAAWGSLAGALGGNNGDTYYLISDMIRIYGNTTYTASFNGDGGGQNGAVLFYFSQFDVNGTYRPEWDGLGITDFNGVDWNTRKHTTFVTHPDAVYVKVVVAKPGWNNGMPFNAFISRIMLSVGSTQVGWNDDATARDTFARVTQTEQATSDLYGRTMARWAIGTAVPGADAFISAQAETTPGQAATSSVAIGAKLFAVFNQVGANWVEALRVANGSALFSGTLQASVGIRLGNGQGWPLARASVNFDLSDGQVCSYGTDLGGLPQLEFLRNNLAPLGSGETYNVYAESPTATGFTLRAKINVPGVPSNQTVPGSGYAETISGPAGRTLYLQNRPNSQSGDGYYLEVNGVQQHRIIPSGGGVIIADNEDYTNIQLGLWAYNGSWQKVGDIFATSVCDPDNYFGSFNTPINVDESWYWADSVSLPPNTTHIHVNRYGADNGRPGSISGVGPISWQAAGTAGGVRSATPNGEKTRVKVTPL